jgi:hypothetical protein
MWTADRKGNIYRDGVRIGMMENPDPRLSGQVYATFLAMAANHFEKFLGEADKIPGRSRFKLRATESAAQMDLFP